MKKNLKAKIESIEGVKVYGDLLKIESDSSVLYPLPLVQGNSKIGKNVWHASTLPTSKKITASVNGVTVSECGTCPVDCVGCYGTKGNYNFNSVKYALIMRTRFLKKHTDIYFQVCRYQIEAENIRYIRIHATGDFLPGEAAGWHDIFESMPDLKGWTYTKCDIKGDIERLNALQNFNIVNSIIKGCGFNFGHIDYILSVYNRLTEAGKNVYICRCGIDKNQHCENCTGCSHNDYVLFIEHSTDYKAEKDPLYQDIKKLIESQPPQLLS